MNREALADLAPMLRRVVELNPHAPALLRPRGPAAALFARLPFGVLVARTIAVDADDPPAGEHAFRAADLLAWLDGDAAAPLPRARLWRGPLPPADGWRRLEQVPDGEIRRVVRAGALALKEAAEREGVPKGTPPRKEVADALLDAVGLTISAAQGSAEITVRSLSALTRMGFLARGSHAFVDACGGWTRVVASYGTVYAEAPPALTPR